MLFRAGRQNERSDEVTTAGIETVRLSHWQTLQLGEMIAAYINLSGCGRFFFTATRWMIFFASLAGTQVCHAETSPEVRGAWLTADGTGTNSRTEDIQQLREIGLNTLYVECWDNGSTEFPSEVMREMVGLPMPAKDAPPELRPDVLDETLNAAHREGLICMAWFEFGFAAGTRRNGNALREKHPDWLMTTCDGKLASRQNQFIWMNPLRPECQQLLKGIVLEAITNYDLDGVQMDDHTAWPVSMGYDAYTIERYREEHGGKSPPTNQHDPAWIAWRAEKVTDFVAELYHACKAANPNILVSISPAVAPWAYENYACDWPRWAKSGWMDECVPQDYRFDYSAFAQTWSGQVSAMEGRTNDLMAGILISEGRRENSWPDLVKEISLVRQSGASGHVWWYGKGVLNLYAEQLKAFYDVAHLGPAPHPKLGPNHRPKPLVLARDDSDSATARRWSGKDIPLGNYRVIGRFGQAWRTLGTLRVTSGNGTSRVTVVNSRGAEAVELLVDRRPSFTRSIINQLTYK